MKENKKRPKHWTSRFAGIIVTCVIISYIMLSNYVPYISDANIKTKDATYSEFIKELDSGNIDTVTINGKTIIAQSKETDGLVWQYVVNKIEDPDLVARMLKSEVEFKQVKDNSGLIFNLISMLLPVAVYIWLFKGLFKKNGIMSVGKSTAKEYDIDKSTGILFKDVAGADEAKESLIEIVDFLHNPKKYKEMGAKLPKGALLVGPPGTGKTMLAKAVAGEAKVPFYSLSGSDFIEMYAGVGASRVRDLFKTATQTAPCIIFIDEIDAIGKAREGQLSSNDEREQTLNQLLSEMDGFDSSKGIILLGATNRPEILDKALLRPGRFDRRILVEKPDLKGRVEILKVHSKNVKMDESVDMNKVALATSGVAGADLANIVNEAAITAAKKGLASVSQKELIEAVEIVLVGKEKKDRVLSAEEKKVVAYHEIGHALASAIQKNSEPVQKITIIPRTMGALGYVMQVPEKEKYLYTKQELEQQLVSLLAGRAAEEIFFKTVTTGAANDIERATDIARSMITQYGMSDKFGLVGFETTESRYLSNTKTLKCGDLTAADIDNEVIRILKESYEKAKRIISSHMDTMECLSDFLIQKETISGKEFMDILRKSEKNKKS